MKRIFEATEQRLFYSVFKAKPPMTGLSFEIVDNVYLQALPKESKWKTTQTQRS